jgi:hypothetical protein
MQWRYDACQDGKMSDDDLSGERDFNASNIEEFRRNGGEVGGQFEGFEVVKQRAPGFADYETRTDRVIPVFELSFDS